MTAEEKTRVDFNAPTALVERADEIAAVLDTSRTQLLVDALRDELDELANDEGFRRELSQAYYDGRIGFETVEAVLGTEDALRLKLLRESIDRDPPEPQLDRDLPSQDEFYDEAVPQWTPDEEGDESD